MENSNLNFDEFKNVQKAEWMEMATLQLNGDLPADRLEWSSEFGLPLSTYYDVSDHASLAYLTKFFSSVSHHKWNLYERIIVDDITEANINALDALNGGCDGVLFSIDHIVDFEALTKNILFEHCEISFLIRDNLKKKTEAFCKTHDIQGFQITTDSVCSGWHSDMFSQSSGLENLTEMVIDFAQCPGERPFIFLIMSQDFFHEMARVRAVRYLFWRVSVAMGVQLNPDDILIHCEPIGLESRDENLFIHSTAGLAAIIGGANSISFNSMNWNRRISRNVGNLIREESKISTFQHVGSGSYFIDNLTDQMIQHVWKELQERVVS